MNKLIGVGAFAALLSLVWTAAAWAQRPDDHRRDRDEHHWRDEHRGWDEHHWQDDRFRPAYRPHWGEPIPNVVGTWYLNGNPATPCQIVQEGPDGSALFTNENGSQAWGSVRGYHVYIPSWSAGPGSAGLWGTIRGDRIVWPNGTFWSRTPL